LAGTVANTGEGGMLPEERKFARRLVIQYSTGRFGIDEEILKKADIVEIKIGQGAKGGQGGLLQKEKVTPEIAATRRVQIGTDVHSPAYHPDIKSIEDLKGKVDWLRKLTGGVPIAIKFAAGDVVNDIKFAVAAGSDIIGIDGIGGGTGAAPEVMLDEVGIPILPALARARQVLDEIGAAQELWVGGGFYYWRRRRQSTGAGRGCGVYGFGDAGGVGMRGMQFMLYRPMPQGSGHAGSSAGEKP